jgi:hypothetical protein
MKRILSVILIIICFSADAQTTPEKNIRVQNQVWLALNNVVRLSNNWGALADFHVRRNDFIKEPGFYLIRFAGQYWLKENATLALGYAHMWNAPAVDEWKTFSNENRIYQQFQFSHKLDKTYFLFRLRNEQRKIEIMRADTFSGDYLQTDRVRMLVSLNIPISKNPRAPELLIADEVLINFGPDVVYNTFDQNRFTVGLRKKLNNIWSYDLAYMLIFQQKSTGIDYDLNNTLRIFFYANFDFRKKKSDQEENQRISGEE